MSFWLTSLAIIAELLVITTAASHRLRDSPISIRDSANEAGNDVCVTQECYDTASRIKNNMDLEINPCDDFYKYACGSFVKNTPLPLRGFTNSATIAQEQFHSQLKSLFEMAPEINDTEPFRQAKTLYASCMDEKTIEANGILRLKEFTQRFGGWPVVEGDSWNESHFNWEQSIAKTYRAGLRSNSFIDIDIEVDSQNNLRRVISLDAPHVFEYYIFQRGTNSTNAKEYYQIMVDTAVSLGAERKMAEEELMEAILFQIELNKAKGAAEAEAESRMTLSELIERYPSVDWINIFTTMYRPMSKIADSDVVVVKKPNFIDQLISLISRKPKRVQANFAMLQIIQDPVKEFSQGLD